MDDLNFFEKYPDILIIADPIDPVYKIKYLEKVKERSGIRFERREKIVPREKIENIVSQIILD